MFASLRISDQIFYMDNWFKQFTDLLNQRNPYPNLTRLADAAKLSSGYLYEITGGKRHPSPKALKALLDAMEIDQATKSKLLDGLNDARGSSRLSPPKGENVNATSDIKSLVRSLGYDYEECEIRLGQGDVRTYDTAFILDSDAWAKDCDGIDVVATESPKTVGRRVILFAYNRLPDMIMAYGKAAQGMIEQNCEAALLVIIHPWRVENPLPEWVRKHGKKAEQPVEVVSNWDLEKKLESFLLKPKKGTIK